MDRDALKALLEAIIYVSEDSVGVAALEKVLKGTPRDEIRAALDELVSAGQAPGRGVEIRHVAGGYRMYTKPEHHEQVRAFVRSQRPPLRLSMPALETLAVIAYKQPATGPEIHNIRGVDPSSAIATLLEKGLIVTAGRKPVVGRPILYRTSKEFLLRFGLSDVGELPTLKEFEELARASLGDLQPTALESAPAESSEAPDSDKEAADAGNA